MGRCGKRGGKPEVTGRNAPFHEDQHSGIFRKISKFSEKFHENCAFSGTEAPNVCPEPPPGCFESEFARFLGVNGVVLMCKWRDFGGFGGENGLQSTFFPSAPLFVRGFGVASHEPPYIRASDH